MKPFFSVITVVYNDSIGLQSTFKSICSQSSEDWEWIVVDGASTDGTADYAKSLAEYCSVVVSEPDAGIYDAMNKGAQLATGKYLLFLNAGDLLAANNTLELIRDAIGSSEGSDADIVLGATIQAFPPELRVNRTAKEMSYLWHGVPAFHQSVLLRREACVNPLYNLDYTLFADYELVARMYVQGASWKTLDVPVAIFFVGGRSYQKPIKALVESWGVQKNVLRSPLSLRVVSFARGLSRYAITAILSAAGPRIQRSLMQRMVRGDPAE